MIDDSGRHEQGSFEGCMVHDVEDCRDLPQWRVESYKKGDQSEMADGRIGKQALQVLLEKGNERTENECQQASRTYQPQPLVRATERRPEPHEEEHAGLDHRGRVQVGRHRRGCRHRVGKPDVKGKLGALRKCAE